MKHLCENRSGSVAYQLSACAAFEKSFAFGRLPAKMVDEDIGVDKNVITIPEISQGHILAQ